MMDTKKDKEWLIRARLAHDHLINLSRKAGLKDESALFLDILDLLAATELPATCYDGIADGSAWREAQLNALWGNYGQVNPRRYVFLSALFLAENSGSLLLSFVRKSNLMKVSRGQAIAAQLLAQQRGRIKGAPIGGWGPVIPDPEAEQTKEISKPIQSDKPKARDPHFHRSQKIVWERCVALGNLYFSGKTHSSIIKPRTFPLLIGPTGAGKSFICREIASSLNAHLLSLSFGRWIPQGSRDGQQTIYSILDALVEYPRVICVIDELDKISGWSDSWSRSVANDIWAALDLNFPLDTYARSQKKEGKRTPPDISRLWFIGAGTWQSITSDRSGAGGIGFHSDPRQNNRLDVLARVRDSKEVPEELTARFHVQPLLLTYPDPDEVASLLEEYGLVELATQAGVNLNDIKFDFTKGGMRVIEGLAADLMLKIQQQERSGIFND